MVGFGEPVLQGGCVMRVAELQDMLRACDPDMRVLIDDTGFDDSVEMQSEDVGKQMMYVGDDPKTAEVCVVIGLDRGAK